MKFDLHKIRTVRKTMRMSQCDVADAVGIDQGTYSRKERGDGSVFNIDELSSIAEFLEVDMVDFFKFSDQEQVANKLDSTEMEAILDQKDKIIKQQSRIIELLTTELEILKRAVP